MTTVALRVAVVGGGVTGLAVAHALVAQAAEPGGVPVEVTLLEASDRLGGKVQTEQVGRLLLEQGPDAMFLRSPFAVEFCRRIGLGEEMVRADGAHRRSYILRRGRLHPIPSGMEGGVPRSVWPMAASRLLSPWGKLRALLEVAVPGSSQHGDESLDAFIRRRFGAEVADRVAAPLLGGIYSNELPRISLLSTMPHLREGERRHRSLLLGAWKARGTPRPGGGVSPFVSLRGGLVSLPAALASRLHGARVLLDTTVRSIAPQADGASFRLAFRDGEHLEADRVVVTVPAFAAADMLTDISPSAAENLAGICYSSVVVVTLAFPAETAAKIPVGGGFVVAPDEGRLLSAGSFTSQKWPHCAPGGELLVRCHLHAERNPEILTAGDRTLVAAALAELRDLFGIGAEPTVTRVYRWPRALPSYEVGHLERLAAVERALSDLPGLVLAGAGYRGAGIPECLRQGETAAARVLQVGAARTDAPSLAAAGR